MNGDLMERKKDEKLSADEIAERVQRALQRSFTLPHKPQRAARREKKNSKRTMSARARKQP